MSQHYSLRSLTESGNRQVHVFWTSNPGNAPDLIGISPLWQLIIKY